MLIAPAPLLLLAGFARPADDTRHDAPARMSEDPANPRPADDPAEELARLVQAMAGGDRAALARLYDLLGGPLHALALRVLNDSAEAPDIVHDAFLQLWRKAGDYEPARGSVFAWAATLVRNRAIDRVRTRKRRTEILHGSAAEILPAAVGDSDAADRLGLAEQAGAVRAALAALAPEQRTALELAYFGGLTQQEISARLNEPLGTIKARIRRGLLRLRETLPARP